MEVPDAALKRKNGIADAVYEGPDCGLELFLTNLNKYVDHAIGCPRCNNNLRMKGYAVRDVKEAFGIVL